MDICLAGRPCIAAMREALHSSNHLFLDLLGKLASENPPSTIPNNLCYNQPEASHSDADRFSVVCG